MSRRRRGECLSDDSDTRNNKSNKRADERGDENSSLVINTTNDRALPHPPRTERQSDALAAEKMGGGPFKERMSSQRIEEELPAVKEFQMTGSFTSHPPSNTHETHLLRRSTVVCSSHHRSPELMGGGTAHKTSPFHTSPLPSDHTADRPRFLYFFHAAAANH